jgi:hypothetical protein
MTGRALSFLAIVALAGGVLRCGMLGAEGGPDVPADSSPPDSDVPRDQPADVPTGVCNAGDLAATLHRAANGDLIRLDSCRIEGAFVVPAGVTLVGVPGTILASPAGVRRPVLALRTSPGVATQVAALEVESDANFGIVADGGGGEVDLATVTVRATRGVAVGLQDLASLKLTDVVLRGPFADGGTMRPAEALPEATATHGLLVIRAGTATIERTEAHGFAGFGAVLVETTTTWTDGGATDNLGTGLAVWAGTTTLTRIDLSGTHWSGGPVVPSLDPGGATRPYSFGGVFLGGAGVQTTGLVVSDGEGFGLVHDGGSGRHELLTAENNGDAAVWAQGTQSLEIFGAGSALFGNRYAGVVLVEPQPVTIRDLVVEGTRRGCRDCGTSAQQVAADGIQIVRPQATLTLQGLTLHDNARIGLLLDMGGRNMDAVTLGAIDVAGTGTQQGAMAQNGVFPTGWDDPIARDDSTLSNDENYRGERLPVSGRLGRGRFPSIERLTREGLRGIINPDPPT